MVSTCRNWFTIHDDSLRVAFECDRFHTKVIQSRGKPFLKLPTVDEEPGRPDGPVLVRLPDGREWEFRFVKIACNVAGPRDTKVGDKLQNELPAILREWFGPDAGLPGTTFEVEFTSDGPTWLAAPISLREEIGARHEAPAECLAPFSGAPSFPHSLPTPARPPHHPHPRLRPHRLRRLLGTGEPA